MTEPARLALHQGTTEGEWGFVESVEGYARHGIPALTVRRSLVEEYGVARHRGNLRGRRLAHEKSRRWTRRLFALGFGEICAAR